MKIKYGTHTELDHKLSSGATKSGDWWWPPSGVRKFDLITASETRPTNVVTEGRRGKREAQPGSVAITNQIKRLKCFERKHLQFRINRDGVLRLFAVNC
jgi:hypothetical protein